MTFVTVPRYPLYADDAIPATPAGPADRSRKAERKLATVAAQTLQDAIQRSAIAAGADPLAVSPGLRGGSSSVDADRPGGQLDARVVDDRFVRDVAVSGPASWNGVNAVDATLTLRGHRVWGSVTIHNDVLPDTSGGTHPPYRVTGTINGRTVDLVVPT